LLRRILGWNCCLHWPVKKKHLYGKKGKVEGGPESGVPVEIK